MIEFPITVRSPLSSASAVWN